MAGESDLINALESALAKYRAANSPTINGPTLALIGDSRLNGDWNSLLGRNDIANLSVAGSKTTDWLANWQANIALIPNTVTKAIVQFGKNDIDAEYTDYQIAHGLQDIATLIHNYTNITVGVLAPLPVTSTASGASNTNSRTAGLLPDIISECSNATPEIEYYEGYQTLVSSGALLSQYADTGGTHLNGAGRDIYKNSITTLEGMLD
jgi:hypothetical protein